MGYYVLWELTERVMETKKDLPLQMVNGDHLKVFYFDRDAEWHIEDRDEFFVCLWGTVKFSIEGKDYNLKNGDLLVIEAGKGHRASSSGSVLLSLEPHD
jgi:mannose-6-phosphate isomerase-like protein (cupin superfamily)